MIEQDKAQELKKQLDWELSLDSSELVSHGWYHGPLDRAAAEALLPYDGNFLVRDSTTQPGHYVLSCRQGPHFLHFVINRVVIQPDTVYEHFQYQFEDEPYDTVPDLVTSYVGSGKSISSASGAKITTPSNRSAPLLCCQTNINRGTNHTTTKVHGAPAPWKATSPYCSSGATLTTSLTSDSVSLSSFRSPTTHPGDAHVSSALRKANSVCCTAQQCIPSKTDSNESLSKKNPCAVGVGCTSCCRSTSANGEISSGPQWKIAATKSISFSEHNALAGAYNSFANQPSFVDASNPNFKKQRSLSLFPSEIGQAANQKSSSADGVVSEPKRQQIIKDDSKEPVWDSSNSQDTPPAKPARTQPAAYQASGSDSGNGSGDSAQSSAPSDTPQAGEAPRPTTKSIIRHVDIGHAEEALLKASTIEFKEASIFDADAFRSELFSSPDNKPLESDTLQTVKLLLRTSGPMILATHLTRVDLEYIMSSNGRGKNGKPFNKLTGLELSLLAHGGQMRCDIVERAECMKFLIIVTILTCQSDAERADVLNDWIQLAIETKTALGNLFGFSIIMLGLCTKHVKNMENVWNVLRQKHTHSAFTFESKLRPSFKSMNDCLDSSPPNMTIPHLLPVITILHNSESDKCWEEYGANTSDFGLSTIAAHLEAARRYPEQVPFFERNAKVALAATPAPPDEILLDLFRTEFHIKFLWGARGIQATQFERHTKLSDVLNTMSERYLTPVVVK